MKCGAPVPTRPGPGRPRAYCANPKHNAVNKFRADAQTAEQTVADEETVTRIRQAEAGRMAAEIDAHAARRERDAALAMRDLALEDLAAARAELVAVRAEVAETVSRMRADCDQQIARVAAVADAEITQATTAYALGEDPPRRRILAV